MQDSDERNPEASSKFAQGWYLVTWSADLERGEVKPLRYFGKDYVLFRCEDGRATLLDAHCPHLGAHLGYGGRVEGNDIICPFHAWRFGASGRCTEVPYASRIPPRAAVHAYRVQEHSGMIVAYFGGDGSAPDGEELRTDYERDVATYEAARQVHEAKLAAYRQALTTYDEARTAYEAALAELGCRVSIIPAETPTEEILRERPDGLFVSNGPGDPAAVEKAEGAILGLSEAGTPVFGICLGHQLIARAFGARTFKLPFGHHGAKHPVRNLDHGTVEITAQNTGFAVEKDAAGEVPGAPDLRVTHVNLYDDTVEGIAHGEFPVFSVQYHPEAAPGPHDSRYLFRQFVQLMENRGPYR